ncbi:MAG: hypothetical protein WC627_12450 [Legionella sp.]|jgi:hypothetical protein
MKNIDKWDLYKRNLKGVFYGGFVTIHVQGDVYMNLIHLALLPVTLLIIPIIKSIVDIKNRTPIAENRLTQAITGMQELRPGQFDDFINIITGYIGRSKSSRELHYALQKIEKKFTGVKENLQTQAELKYKKGKELSALSELAKFQEPDYQVTVNYTVTPEDVATVKKGLSKDFESADLSRRLEQMDAINEFLLLPHNNGKRMQHVILEVLDKKGFIEDLAAKVTVEIKRLRQNAKTFFSTGNTQKADKVERALEEYKKEDTFANRVKLREELGVSRTGFFGTTKASSHVYGYDETEQNTPNMK